MHACDSLHTEVIQSLKDTTPDNLKKDLSHRARFNRDVIWNLVSVCLLGICGFSLNIILGRYYGAETFGVFSQVLAVYYVFSQLAVGGFVFSTLHLVAAHSMDRETVRKIITSSLILTAGLALLVCITAGFLSGFIGQLFDSENVRKGLLCTIPGLWCFAINKVLLFALNGLRHMRFYAAGNSLRYILILVSLIIMTVLKVESSLLPLCLSAGEFILLPVLALYVLRLYPPSFTALKSWFYRHLHFGGQAFFSGLLMDINLKVDVVLLGYYFPDKVVGIYNFAAMLAIEGLYQFVVAIQMNMNPILTRLRLENRMEDLQKYVKKATFILCPSLALIACIINVLYPSLTLLLTGNPDFIPGRIYFGVLMAGIVMGSSYLPFLFVLNQWGYPGLFTLFLLAIVATNFILNALLIPVYGALGSAIGTAFSYAATVVYLKLFLRAVKTDFRH